MVLRGDGPDAGSIPVLINLRIRTKGINSDLKTGVNLDRYCKTKLPHKVKSVIIVGVDVLQSRLLFYKELKTDL